MYYQGATPSGGDRMLSLDEENVAANSRVYASVAVVGDGGRNLRFWKISMVIVWMGC
jgi:hypothetical protein